MSKKPSRAQRKEMRARSANARTLSAPKNPPTPSTANAATPSIQDKPKPASSAPKQASARLAKRVPKPIAKTDEPVEKPEQRDSTMPAVSTKKKATPQNAIFAFVGLIVIAIGIAYFATRKPSSAVLQEDKPQTTNPEKQAGKAGDIAPKPVEPPPPTPVVVAPPPTPATPPIAPNDAADKPAPSSAPTSSADKPAPKATAKPSTTTKSPVRPAPARPVAPKGDDYE